MSDESILDKWGITVSELNQIIKENPSMNGLILGYISEFKLRKMYLEGLEISNPHKPDNHDRLQKYDVGFTYKGVAIRLEVKSLQSNGIKQTPEGGYVGTFQCDASDRRPVPLPNGHTVETTCLRVGDFDILAVNLYLFGDQWRFVFARNHELPRTKSPKYSSEDQQYLIRSSMRVTWPPTSPFTVDLFSLLDQIVQEKKSAASS